MAGVTIFALISYFIVPEDKWLPANRISHFIDSKGVTTTIEDVSSSAEYDEHDNTNVASSSNNAK